MTADDEPALRALIGRIEATFGVDLDGWMACFERPMIVVSPVGTLTLADDAAVAARFGPPSATLIGHPAETRALVP